MRVAFTACVLVLATAGSAFAGTAGVDLARSACLAHSANAEAISTDLSARGWRQLSDEERGERDPQNVGAGFVMHWATSQAWGSPDDASVMLTLGEGPLGQGAARADFCMVTQSLGFSQQVRGVRQWLGFDRFQTWGPGGDLFAYLRDAEGNLSDGAHIEDAERDAALNDGRYGLVQVVGDHSTSVINFSVLHPVSPPPERGEGQ